MSRTLKSILGLYNPAAPLAQASTIPAPWYVDPRVAELERQAVFGRAWQAVGRADQLRGKGNFLTAELAGEPIVVVRGEDGVVRGLFNVCRPHAAPLVTAPQGHAAH